MLAISHYSHVFALYYKLHEAIVFELKDRSIGGRKMPLCRRHYASATGTCQTGTPPVESQN
jgi:hypothetical protein